MSTNCPNIFPYQIMFESEPITYKYMCVDIEGKTEKLFES